MNRRQFIAQTAVLGSCGAAESGTAEVVAGGPLPGFTMAGPGRQPDATGPLTATGYAERDITPEIGMEAPGGYGKAYHRAFHDACKVRVAVFDDGSKRTAIVGVDAGAVPRYLVLEAREAIRQRCGIPPEAVLVGASHSHSSGPIDGVRPGSYDHASPLVRKLAYEMSTADNPVYVKRVISQIVDAVAAANGSRAEVRSGAGFGFEDKVAFNRRLRMKNGLTYTHPGQGNPDVLGFAGPTDPQVGVLGSWDKQGRLIGCIVNYSCHATTSPGGISANWIYYMERAIRGTFGQDVIVVFLQGDSGDVTQVDNLSPYTQPDGEHWAQFVGGRVGLEAAKTLLSMPSGALRPVDFGSTVLRIKRRRPSAAHVERAYQIAKQDPKTADATEWAFAKEIVMLDAMLQKEPVADVEVQAVQVGPAVMITNPAELFVQFGLDMKKRSPFPFTFPVELANGCVAYVPTEEAFGAHGGGYETRLTSYSNLEITAGRQIFEAGLRLAGRMKPGRAPEFPKAPPFRTKPGGIGATAWTYGNVPPQLE